MQLPLVVTVDCVGGSSRLSPGGLCCWHLDVHSFFFQSHGFQAFWMHGPNLIEAGLSHCDLGESLTLAEGEGRIDFFAVMK